MSDSQNKITQDLLNIIEASNNYFFGYCTRVNTDGTVNIKKPNGNSIVAETVNVYSTGECVVFKADDNNYYAYNPNETKIDSEKTVINRRSSIQSNQKNLLVKTIVANISKINLGGYAPQKEILDVVANNLSLYVNNLGKDNYLVSTKYTQSGVDKFVSKDSKNAAIIIENSLATQEYYLGKGLWESDSRLSNRISITQNQKYTYPITSVIGSTSGEYGSTFTYPTANIQTDSWLPSGQGNFSFNRARTSVVYERPTLDPINIRNPLGIIVQARYGSFESFRYIRDNEIQSDSYYQQFVIISQPNTQIGDTISVTTGIGESAMLAAVTTTSYTVTFTDRIENEQIFVDVNATIDSITEKIYVSRVVDIIEAPDLGFNFYLNDWFEVGSRDITNASTSPKSYQLSFEVGYSQVSGTRTTNQGTIPLTIFLSYNDFGFSLTHRIVRFTTTNVRYNDFAPRATANVPTYVIAVGDLEVNASGVEQNTYYLSISFPGMIGENSGQRQPKRVDTFSNITVRRKFIPYISEPLPEPPISIKSESYRETTSGNFVGINTVDGYIKQSVNLIKNIQITRFPVYQVSEEITTNINNLIYYYADKQINLNTDDFLVVGNWQLTSSLNLNTTVLTVTTYISPSFLSKITKFIGQQVILNVLISGNYYLIKGVINSLTVSQTYGTIVFSIGISSIELSKKTSFLNKIILNNGSFWNFFFRKDTSAFLSKSSFSLSLSNGQSFTPLMCLNPVVDFQRLNISSYAFFLGSTNLNNFTFTDNVVKNKIYSVVEIPTPRQATVEEWTILSDGGVKFQRIFSTAYSPIFRTPPSFIHSYHPTA